jgi:hypothetical protein
LPNGRYLCPEIGDALLAELNRPDRVTVLRDLVQRSSYHVDPEVVAVAIVERIRPGELQEGAPRARPPYRPGSGDVFEAF